MPVYPQEWQVAAGLLFAVPLTIIGIAAILILMYIVVSWLGDLMDDTKSGSSRRWD